jgi:MFS transporter, UMF1 family
VAWALYDCGSSAFALSVLAVLFPLVLGSVWSAGDDGAVVTQRLTAVNAAASLLVFLLAPILGAVADSGGFRKRFLLMFALLGAGSTAALGLVAEGGWPLALVLFMMASIGYYSANVFYDSLLVDVTEPRLYSAVSATGFAVGYFGSALLLTLHVAILRAPASFGFADTTAVMQFVFVSAGAWWILFVIPLLVLVREGGRPAAKRGHVVRDAYRALAVTFQHIRQYREVMRFLAGYFLYIGGVFTVIVMAVNFGQRLGFSQTDLVSALLITNFAGFPATLLYGYIGHRIGPKRALFIGLAVYIAVACWAVFLEDVRQFYMMAIAIGAVQGGVQGMSRSLYAALIPAEKSGEFFGFYNTLTKLAHVLGPMLVGLGAVLSSDPKFMLVPMLPLFIGGALLLLRVSEPNELRGA